MFTPQKKLWSLSPRTESGPKKGALSVLGSGNPNSVSPSNGDASAGGKAMVAYTGGDGGLGQGSLTERISKLENELFEYQYNMGLLLIEKKEWTSKIEELGESISDATSTLHRERAEHLSAISEVEKREEELKKRLGVETQCRLDLEKTIQEMRLKSAEIRVEADSKLSEASALVASIDQKSLEVEAKFHAVDAKVAEVSRKEAEIERKLQELEVRENTLRRERLLFATEREAREASICKQREDLREWEKKLQDSEDKLAESRRLLNQREERANENDKSLKEKQNDLEELRKRIDFSNSTLKNKEDDISSRLASASLKEKEAEEVRKRLEEKEKQLQELEEKLNAREKLEIQKLMDEHKTILAKKEKEFVLEIEEKRKLHDEQLKDKVLDLEKKETEIAHMEEKVKKREQAIEKKQEKVREKEIDIDSKLKSFREREKSLKTEEKNLEKERKEIHAEKEELLKIKAELENVKTQTEQLQLKLAEEREHLKVTEEERVELSRLQSELKQEIEKYRFESEQVVKEADSLKLEKEKFEKEWEELDDKRADIKKEEETILVLKKQLEKQQQYEQERLENEKLETEKYVQRELEALKLAKDSFAASMEHEKSILEEKSQSEKSKLVNDFEKRKEELETEMQRKQEEMESHLYDREKSFEYERERELNNINYLREVARREMEDMKLERNRMEKEKLELSLNKNHVESRQREIKQDIEELVALSQKLKDQREQFIKERERFIAFAEKQKNCDMCGESIRDFMLSDLHPFAELKNFESSPLLRVAENYSEARGTADRLAAESSPFPVNSGSPTAGGTLSWLRTCTSKIFKFSAGKKLELDDVQDTTGASVPLENPALDSPETIPADEMELQPSLQVANDSYDVQIVESGSAIGDIKPAQALSLDQDPVNIPEKSQNSDRDAPRRWPAKRGGRPRKSRTQSGTSAAAGSEANGDAENSVYTNDESRAESELGIPKDRRKRSRGQESQATVSETQTEGHSDIKDIDRPRTRRRVAAPEQNVQKRYNLRPTKKSTATVENGSLFQRKKGSKGKGKETDQQSSLEASQSEKVETGGVSREQEIDEPGAAYALPRSGAGDDYDPVRSTGIASEFSADSPFKNGGTHGGHDMDQSEVNGAGEDGEPKTESHGDDDSDDDGDNEVNHPGEASIGKKLWTFLTT